jgi:hypothetical protein
VPTPVDLTTGGGGEFGEQISVHALTVLVGPQLALLVDADTLMLYCTPAVKLQIVSCMTSNCTVCSPDDKSGLELGLYDICSAKAPTVKFDSTQKCKFGQLLLPRRVKHSKIVHCDQLTVV